MSKNKLWLNLISSKAGRIFLKTTTSGAGNTTDFRVSARALNNFTGSKWIGTMDTLISKNHSTANVVDTRVYKPFRGQGVSKRMFKMTLQKLDEMGKTFLRSGEVLHPAQVKIRDGYKSKFLGFYIGKYQDEAKLLNSSGAIKLVEKSREGIYSGSVMASTMVPKDINKLPKITIPKDKVRFIRRNGRIIPIRTK